MPLTREEEVKKIGDQILSVVLLQQVDGVDPDTAAFGAACWMIYRQRQTMVDLGEAVDDLMSAAGGEPPTADPLDYSDDEIEDNDRIDRLAWQGYVDLLKEVSKKTGASFSYRDKQFALPSDYTVEDKLDAAQDDD